MEDGGEGVERRLSEVETKTADAGVSVLEIPDKVVHVFHESKGSEGDDVFEEALTDANQEEMMLNPEEHHEKLDPEQHVVNGGENGVSPGNSDPLVANPSSDEVNEADKFEEAAENDGPGESRSCGMKQEQAIAAEEKVETLEDAEHENKTKVMDGVVDDEDNVKALVPKESNGSLVDNGDSGASKPFSESMDGEPEALTDGEEKASRSFNGTVHEKPENDDLDKMKDEEKPSVCSNSVEVGEVDIAEVELIEGNVTDGQTECIDNKVSEAKEDTTSVDASVLEEVGTTDSTNDFIVSGASIDSEKEDLDEKSPLLERSSAKSDASDRADVAEEAVKISQISVAHHTNGNRDESLKDPAVVQAPEELEPEDENAKEGLHPPLPTSTEESAQQRSIRESEIRTVADAAQPSPRPPAGLGGAASLLEPAPRAVQQPRANGGVPQRQTQHIVEDPLNGDAEENDETREKLQMIRVKFLRLAHRLGQTPHNVVVAQVLYRLGLAEQLRGRNTGRVGAFSFDRASAMAEQLEAAGQEPLDFSCTIMVLGKTGVGKSATINSIFDEIKFTTDAFQMATKKVQDVEGTVQGIKVRVIDTPGLLPCWSDQRQNEKILHSVKRFIKKTPPDIVLYLDRLDMQSRDFGDMPLLRTITEIFGPSIWFNAIVVLTHAASAPPDGPNGTASSYEMFVTQRSHAVQQAIRQAAGDMRLMNPVSLVENHSACRTNRAGQRVLPNGQVWKPHLLLLSFASKILAEANTLLKLQDSPPGKPFANRPRVPPLPLLLSSLLQSRPQLKLPEEQFGDDDDSNEDSDDSSGSDDELDYDELPPFKRLTKAQLAKLNKAQKKAYFEELDYREKLFMKKQLKEEKRRQKLLKNMGAAAKDSPNDYNGNVEEESSGSASVPVAMPDFALPTSFDSDNPTHRYRFLDSSNQWLVRPVLETHGWDHDVGYEGINVERLFVVKEKIPLSFSGQVTKDKKESNVQMELASSIRHGEGKATSLGFDMQTVGKDMAYTLRSETRFCNLRRNKTAAGLSVTFLGDALSAGVKLEDRLIVNKRFRLVLTGGAMTGRGDVAYGGSLEATLRDKDYPLGRALSTLGLSIMDWHGDLAVGCNVQTQFPIGRTTTMIGRANLNNRGAGQVSIRLNSSEQLQIALIVLVPLLKKALGHYQQTLYGE